MSGPVPAPRVKKSSSVPSPAAGTPPTTADGSPGNYQAATTADQGNAGFSTGGSSSASGLTLDQIPVYTGNMLPTKVTHMRGIGDDGTPSFTTSYTPEVTNAQDQLNTLYQMSPDQVSALQNKLAQANLLNGNYVPGVVDNATYQAYGNLLVYASQTGDPSMTPDKMLGIAISRGGAAPGGAPQNGTLSHTTSQVDYTDPTVARALVNDTMSRLLGRQATNDEIAQFTNALHAQEASNPQTATQTATYSGGREVSSQTTTTRGFGQVRTTVGATQLAEDQARQNPEFGSYQVATTYMDAFLNALRGPGGGSNG